MAINFPDAPTLGQVFDTYVWDGEKWTSLSSGGGGGGLLPSSAPPIMDGAAAAGSSNLYSRGDHVHPSDTSKATTTQVAARVLKAGDTMGGPLIMQPTDGTNPTLRMNKQAGSHFNLIQGEVDGEKRWELFLGNSAGEVGATGSNFELSAWNDGSKILPTALVIRRQDAQLVLGVDPPTLGAAPATKNYVDAEIDNAIASLQSQITVLQNKTQGFIDPTSTEGIAIKAQLTPSPANLPFLQTNGQIQNVYTTMFKGDMVGVFETPSGSISPPTDALQADRDSGPWKIPFWLRTWTRYGSTDPENHPMNIEAAGGYPKATFGGGATFSEVGDPVDIVIAYADRGVNGEAVPLAESDTQTILRLYGNVMRLDDDGQQVYGAPAALIVLADIINNSGQITLQTVRNGIRGHRVLVTAPDNLNETSLQVECLWQWNNPSDSPDLGLQTYRQYQRVHIGTVGSLPAGARVLYINEEAEGHNSEPAG